MRRAALRPRRPSGPTTAGCFLSRRNAPGPLVVPGRSRASQPCRTVPGSRKHVADSSSSELWDVFHAIACSRQPPPIRSTFISARPLPAQGNRSIPLRCGAGFPTIEERPSLNVCAHALDAAARCSGCCWARWSLLRAWRQWHPRQCSLTADALSTLSSVTPCRPASGHVEQEHMRSGACTEGISHHMVLVSG